MEEKLYLLEEDAEFKSLIHPLRRKEYLMLEESILAEGCRDAIVVWNGIIIDGYNRYEICRKHEVPFRIVEKVFDSRNEVIVWICRNQLGRRNICDETRKFLIGKQYEMEKICHRRRGCRERNQYTVPTDDDMPAFRSRTCQRIATENNITHATVQKYACYAKAIDNISKKVPEFLPMILNGTFKISHKNILAMAEKSEKEMRYLFAQMHQQTKTFLQYHRVRNVLSRAEAADMGTTVPSIKDMPTFDPDAPVTELSLTVPSWISSIKRACSANVSIASDTAKQKLALVLKDLEQNVIQMLEKIEEKTDE